MCLIRLGDRFADKISSLSHRTKSKASTPVRQLAIDLLRKFGGVKQSQDDQTETGRGRTIPSTT
jgi:hypothetical protein